MQALVKKHALTCAERSAVDRTVQDIKLGRVPRCGDCDRSRSVIRAFHAAAGQNFGLLGGGFLLGGGWMLQWRPLGCFLILELHSVDGLALLRQTCSRATCSRATCNVLAGLFRVPQSKENFFVGLPTSYQPTQHPHDDAAIARAPVATPRALSPPRWRTPSLTRSVLLGRGSPGAQIRQEKAVLDLVINT